MGVVIKEIGFIFINSEGHYAYTAQTGGFRQVCDMVAWTKELNRAEIFPHEDVARRKFKELGKCQALKASATRQVAIGEWEGTPELQQEHPVMPGMPWAQPDKKRRVRVPSAGGYMYFDDTDKIDVNFTGSVEFINSDAKLLFS